LSILRAFNRLLVRVETVLLVAFLAVMIVFAFMQVILRNVFSSGLLWGDPLVRQMVLWSGFVGAALAASQDRHISIDALTKFLSPRVKSSAQILTSLFAAGVCYFLGASAWTFLLDERASGNELFLSIPSWIGLLIIPVGYWLLGVHFLLNAVESGAAVLGKQPDEVRP
jgi:TRAP-type C4-dicarboxylate transport system permease small subunit